RPTGSRSSASAARCRSTSPSPRAARGRSRTLRPPDDDDSKRDPPAADDESRRVRALLHHDGGIDARVPVSGLLRGNPGGPPALSPQARRRERPFDRVRRPRRALPSLSRDRRCRGGRRGFEEEGCSPREGRARDSLGHAGVRRQGRPGPHAVLRSAAGGKHGDSSTHQLRLVVRKEIGFSRAVVDGDWVFVSGTTGFDYRSMTISESVTDQAEQCLRNIQSALEQAGASLRDVVRVTYILPETKDFPQCWPILKKYLGDVRPAATMISAGLADPRIRIEIEVTAHRQAR